MEKLTEQVIHFAELTQEQQKLIHADIQPKMDAEEGASSKLTRPKQLKQRKPYSSPRKKR